MSEAKQAGSVSGPHTPGPWKVWEDHLSIHAPPIEYNTLRHISHGGEVASCLSDSFPDNVCHANARLIAVAPALLDACLAAVRYDDAIKRCGNDPDKMASHCTAQGQTLDDLYEDWMLKSRAAVAQAATESGAECGKPGEAL